MNQQDKTNIFTSHISGFAKTAAFSVDDINGNCTATNASTSDYIALFPKLALRIGYEYKIEIDIGATNGNGLELKIFTQDGTAIPYFTQTIGQLPDTTYYVYFRPVARTDVLVFYGTGNSNVTITDIQLRQVNTVATTTQKIKFHKDAKYRVKAIEYTHPLTSTFDTGEAVLLPSETEPNVVDGFSELEISLSRETSGYSAVEYELTAEYEYFYVDQNAGTITLEIVTSKIVTIAVRKE